MYLTRLEIRHLKLLANFDMSFAQPDGVPRKWTVFLGENGCCKSTVLQAIALAATGPEQGNTLAGDIRPSLRDKRGESAGTARAWFTFSERYHDNREYPGLPRSAKPPTLRSDVEFPPGTAVVRGSSSFVDGERLVGSGGDPLREIRAAEGKNHWFCAGYGVSRSIVVPQSTVTDSRVPVVDRLRSLFDARHALIGTDFISRFAGDEAREFAQRLREALVDDGILPGISGVELRGRGGVSKNEALSKPTASIKRSATALYFDSPQCGSLTATSRPSRGLQTSSDRSSSKQRPPASLWTRWKVSSWLTSSIFTFIRAGSAGS